MTTIIWGNAALLAGGAMASAVSINILTRGVVKAYEKLRTHRYRKKIDEIEKLNSMLKFSTIPQKEHKRVINEKLGERALLLEQINSLKKGKGELNNRVYHLSRRNSALTRADEENTVLREKLNRLNEEHETALENVRSYAMLLAEYLDYASIDVILALLDVHPYTISTNDIAAVLDKAVDSVYETCSTLQKSGWVKKSRTRRKREDCEWGLNEKKRIRLIKAL